MANFEQGINLTERDYLQYRQERVKSLYGAVIKSKATGVISIGRRAYLFQGK